MNLLFLAPLLTLAIPPAFQHGDWIAGCDNHRDCQAIALPREDHGGSAGPPDWALGIVRGPAAAAPPALTIQQAYGDVDVPSQTASLRIDGRAFPARFDENGDLVGDPLPLLRALAVAKRAEVIDAGGKAVGELPLGGSAAVLRWVDAQQKRAGTVTAMVATGPRPASTVPPPPERPRIAVPEAGTAPPPKVSAAWWRQVQRLGRDWCEAEKAGGSLDRLDPATSVAIAGCWMGAYQSASLVLLVDNRGRARPAPIEWPRDANREADDAFVVTEADYDPKTHLLTMAAKLRGLGDCWELASWAWDGKAFRLAQYGLLDQCRGAFLGATLPRWQTANDPDPAP